MDLLPNESEIKEHLKNLSEEFDSLGLPSINVNVDVLEQLMNSIYGLIHMYRKSIAQNKELAVKQSALVNKTQNLEKQIDQVNSKLVTKESENVILSETLRKKDYDIESLKTDKTLLSKNVCALKNWSAQNERQLKHKLNSLEQEKESLKIKLGESIGIYASRDDATVEMLHKYKAKEEIYLDTINKLQQNNEQLLNEVLSLKEEVIIALCNTNTL